MEFKQKLSAYIDEINAALERYVPERDTPEKTIYSAMRYSLMAGGKRLRPVLALSVAEMLGGTLEDVMPFACAIEMIHTYSLIHDDLPAMDNDDYRRGRLTNHKIYGEAMAVLAGDALLNRAFELMLDALAGDRNTGPKIQAASMIAKSAGTGGMIGGQVVDLESEGKMISGDVLEYMHKCKTGALIKAPVVTAALVCGADGKQMRDLETFAEKIGLAFQVKDDILDVEGDDALLGKKTGSDEANGKSTFITIHGLEESKRMLTEITEQAVAAIDDFGERAWFLKELAEYLLKREN